MLIWQSHSGGALAPRKFACLHKQPGRRATRGRFDATCTLPREGPWNPKKRYVPDYNVMRLVGFPTCPRDACSEILSISSYVSHANGGGGAVRDVIERTLRLKGHWLPSDKDDDLPTSV